MSVGILKLSNARLVSKKTPPVSTRGENREASTEPARRGRRVAPEPAPSTPRAKAYGVCANAAPARGPTSRRRTCEKRLRLAAGKSECIGLSPDN